jgi:hypothetical protein
MVIGDYLGYSSLGYGLLRTQINPKERDTVILDAKLDPKKPNEYSVQTTLNSPLIPPPEKTGEAKSSSKRAPQNTDPVSRIFNAVADSTSIRKSIIDIFV